MAKEQQIEKNTLAYIIKTLLSKTKSRADFKNTYDYVTNLMLEEEIYSLSTIIKTAE